MDELIKLRVIKHREQANKWADNNRDKVRKYSNSYYQKNKAKILMLRKARRQRLKAELQKSTD